MNLFQLSSSQSLGTLMDVDFNPPFPDESVAAPRRWLQYGLYLLFAVLEIYLLPVYQAEKWYREMAEEELAVNRLRPFATLEQASDDGEKPSHLLTAFLDQNDRPIRWSFPDNIADEGTSCCRPPDWFRRLVGKPYFHNTARVFSRTRCFSADGKRLPETVEPPPGFYEAFREIRHLKGLRVLAIERWASNEMLANLAGLDYLEAIYLRTGPSMPSVTAAGIAHLQQLPMLRELELVITKQEDLVQIGKLTKLKKLRIFLSDPKEKIDFSVLSEIQCLEQLFFRVGFNADIPVSGLGKLHNLQTLVIEGGLGLTEEGLSELGKLKNLKTLDIRVATGVKDAGLKKLASLDNLEELTIFGNTLSGTGFSELTNLPKLKDLDLEYFPVTDEGLAAIAQVKSLESIFMKDRYCTLSGVLKLSALPNLKHFTIMSKNLDQAVLQAAFPEKCKILVIR